MGHCGYRSHLVVLQALRLHSASTSAGDDALLTTRAGVRPTKETSEEKHMFLPRSARKAAAIVAVTSLGGLATWTGLAGANAQPGPSGLAVESDGKVAVQDRIHINMRRGTEVTTTHISVAPGGHTVWHHHPGPHVVAVTTGEVVVYETDCTVRGSGSFEAGEGFFDPGSLRPRHIHTLHNPGEEVAEVVITDFREPGRALTVPADPQPTSVCF